MDNKNIFARNLKKYMNLNNKTRKEICSDLGFSYYTFSDWVNGKKYPRMDKVEILANYFGILKSDLIEDKSNKKSNIKELRQKRDVTLNEMANELGIEPSILEQYENGTRKIPYEIIEKFALYYNVSVDEIMGIHVGIENKATFVTQDKELLNRYKRWQNEIGYESNFTDEQINHLIEFAKLVKIMNNDEVTQAIKYIEFLINQRENKVVMRGI